MGEHLLLLDNFQIKGRVLVIEIGLHCCNVQRFQNAKLYRVTISAHYAKITEGHSTIASLTVVSDGRMLSGGWR